MDSTRGLQESDVSSFPGFWQDARRGAAANLEHLPTIPSDLRTPIASPIELVPRRVWLKVIYGWDTSSSTDALAQLIMARWFFFIDDQSSL